MDKYKVTSPSPLGPLLLVRLEKQRYFIEDNWFCRYVTVESPQGHKATFPCYRWLIGDTKVEIREGTGRKLQPKCLLHKNINRFVLKAVYKVNKNGARTDPWGTPIKLHCSSAWLSKYVFYHSAKRLKDDSLPELLAHRKAELRERRKTYRSPTHPILALL